MSQSPKPNRKPNPEKPSASLRSRALKLLARREHSRVELQRKLAPHAEDPAALESLLDELMAHGWLAEGRVAEQLIHARRPRFGSGRIRQELLARGVAEEVVVSKEAIQHTEQVRGTVRREEVDVIDETGATGLVNEPLVEQDRAI